MILDSLRKGMDGSLVDLDMISSRQSREVFELDFNSKSY